MKQSLLILIAFFSLHSLFAYNGELNGELPKGKAKELIASRLPLPMKGNNLKKAMVNHTNKTHFITKKMYQDDFLYETPQFNITKVYPNPAREVAYMNYTLQQDLEAKVTIRNLLGKVVKEYELVKGSHEIKIPTIQFDAGVYFYTLSINGKSLKAKKLIVE